MNLVNPTTQIETLISTNKLSTVVENKNVEIKVILKTNDMSCDLYKNPTVTIELPNYIQNININDIKLLFDEQLQIENYELQGNIIKVKIKGEDTKFNLDAMTKGANLVINANITLKELTPTKKEMLKVYVTNENAVNYGIQTMSLDTNSANAYQEMMIQAVAPVGVVLTNSVENYNNQETVTAITEDKEVLLETNSQAKNANIKMNVINNYENPLNKVTILGRIPFAGNKNIGNGKSLESNLNLTLNSGITVTGIDAQKVTIYYSTKENATKEITNENAWETNPQNYENIKSYLIVLNDYEMQTGDTIEFSYGITIPENLTKNLKTSAVYTAYFNNVKENETIEESATSPIITLATEKEEIQTQTQVPQEQPKQEEQPSKEKNSDIEAILETNPVPANYPRNEGDSLQYSIDIINMNEEIKENLTITDTLPEGVTFLEVYDDGKYDKQTNTVTWTIDKLKAKETKSLVMKVVVDDLEEGKYQKTITNQAIVKYGETEVKSNSLSFEVIKPKLEITQTSKTQKEVKEGDIITYDVVIENKGTDFSTMVKISDLMSEGLEFVNAQYSMNGKTQEVNEIFSLVNIKNGEKVELTIKLRAMKLEDGVDKKEVKNVIKVEQDNEDEILSNEIVNIVVRGSSNSNIQDPSTDGENQEGTYSISGIAWEDTNSNGKQDENENGIDNITALLMNSEDGKIVKDITTGNEKKQQTQQGGNYIFTNLKQGNYKVVFLYDSNTYGVTVYQKEGILENKNSDFIAMQINFQGETRQAGVSEKLELKDKNIENIDMGLIKNPKFDLKLDKVISKITKQTSGKNTEYAYKDTKLAKLDIKDKEVNSTSIIVEYKIKVTNEGDLAGYAKKVVDYIPQGMTFSSNLNPDWYQSTNGSIYNASLANEIILPTETKELTLRLTKKMNENNIGIINNTAEISESYNELGLFDIDSSAGNKIQDEDDISSADAMVSIKTGEVYIYIVITLICAGTLAVGIYLINRKVFKR